MSESTLLIPGEHDVIDAPMAAGSGGASAMATLSLDDELTNAGLAVPTPLERRAHTLHAKWGKTDREIGRFLGRSREWVTRLRKRYREKRKAWVRFAVDHDYGPDLVDRICGSE